MKRLNQKLLFICLLFTIGLVFLIIASFLIEPEVVEITPLPPQASAPIEDKESTIILVGDIMLNRGVEDMIDKHGDGDFNFPFLKIANYLNKANIVFGNLESVISDKGNRIGSIYSFRAEPETVEGLTFAGFNVLSLANNHAFDYGRAALEDTFLRLKEVGIDCVGAGFNEEEAYFPIIKDIEGTKIAFLAYTNLGSPSWAAKGENSGIAWVPENDFEKIKENIKSAKENSDVLIVSLHAGEEYQAELTEFQIDFAKAAIDAGADLVVGHHPHMIQPVEEYGQGYIVYSLGNFIFDQDFSDETMKGILLKVIVREGKIENVIPVEIKINQYFQPEIESPIFLILKRTATTIDKFNNRYYNLGSQKWRVKKIKYSGGELEKNMDNYNCGDSRSCNLLRVVTERTT
ncbi:MAG TPA: CapA family protein [Candidatus Humimicrobiaceae bacterium]|nr:CapA family protein [Candidatus Humimicrobiaceae bacterium]